MNEQAQQITNILTQALPYIQRFHGKTMVIKYGGNAMTEDKLKQQFASDVTLLKAVGMNPVVVHGGGPQMGNLLQRLGKDTQFIDGMRITDDETMEVAEMVLGGSVNKSIVQLIHQTGGKAVGLSGTDGHLLEAVKYHKSETSNHDLGRVGTVNKVNTSIISTLFKDDYIPVIAPIGVDTRGLSLNVNADLAASAIAQALKAEKLLLLTNTTGVLDEKGNLLTGLNRNSIAQLIKNGTIKGGMLPKIQCAIDAISNGVANVQIIDGRTEHSILLEIFTNKGVGTLISAT